MKIKSLKKISFPISLTLAITFFLAFFIYSQLRIQMKKIQIEEKMVESARLLGNPIWNFDTKTVDIHLQVLYDLDEILWIELLNEYDEVLWTRKSKITKGFLGALGEVCLRKPISYSHSISFKDQIIGTINTKWRPSLILEFFHVFFVLITVYLIIIFFVLHNKTNKKLGYALNVQKEMQGIIMAKEKMIAISKIIAGVAHEINTPLGCSITVSSSLQDRIQELLELAGSTQAQDSMKDLKQRIDLLTDYLSQMVRLVGQMQRFNITFAAETAENIKVSVLINQITSNLTPSFAGGIQLHPLSELDIEIKSYPLAFELVLNMFLSHIMDQHFKQKEPGQISIRIHKKKTNVVIKIIDDGDPLSKEHIDMALDYTESVNPLGGASSLSLYTGASILSSKLKGAFKQFSLEEGNTTEIVLPLELK